MSELRVVRGRDIRMFVNNDTLFGVISFSAKEMRSYHAVREFLSASPVDMVPQGEEYELKLKTMTLFGDQLPSAATFKLRLIEDGEEFTYSGCRVTQTDQEADGGKIAGQVYIITADSFTRRVIDDE